MNVRRRPRGSAGSTGGQFAERARGEANVNLEPPVDGARPKVVRVDSWDSDSVVTVWLAEKPFDYRREFEVFDEHGTPLGTIQSGSARSERKIAGTRLVSRGKETQVWFSAVPQGRPSYWDDQPSQAAAIRQLIVAAQNAARRNR